MSRLPHTRPLVTVAALSVALIVGGCGDDSPTSSGGSSTTRDGSTSTSEPAAEPVIDPGDGGNYQPELTAADTVPVVDNPYFPLIPGSKWVYEGETDEGTERVEVVVQPETREVTGIDATVVRDTVRIGGEVVEDTYDWFTQDTDGNVWYLGEEVKNFKDGQLEDTDGSWEAGVDGALPGIVMLADPKVGDAYRQEYWEDEAEDLGEVLAVNGTRTVRAGDYTEVLTTRDWNPLEPEVVEEKSYAPGVGLIFEEKVEGDDEQVELITFEPGSEA